MLGTMRVSSLAFAITDSEKNEEDLTPLQRKHVVRYVLVFHGVLLT